MKNLIVLLIILLIQPTMAFPQKRFTHRGYLGWLVDISRTARIGVEWPSIVIDEALINDYKETIDFLKRSSQNEISAWGFFTNSVWEPEIERTIDEERKLKVVEMISYAHSKGIKILCGLGVYSWGFNKIIEQHPEVACSCNKEVMDFAKTESWEWQKKVIDYLMDNYEFDGFSMQSADLGRCKCGEYAGLTDLEYHAMLDQKVVNYIRSRKKNAVIGISGWGMNFSSPKDQQSIVKMTRNVDYLIDVEETALKEGREYRRKLIKAIAPCTYGSTTTPNIEPIQALPRDRYFVPIIKRSCQRIKEIFQDGGRASETYVRTRGNIGDEITVEVITRIINNPDKGTEECLEETLTEIFQPNDKKALEDLKDIFTKAEDAYFSCATGDKEVIQLMPRSLKSPVSRYLTDMTPVSRKKYLMVMGELFQKAEQLKGEIKNEQKFQALSQCLSCVITEGDKLK